MSELEKLDKKLRLVQNTLRNSYSEVSEMRNVVSALINTKPKRESKKEDLTEKYRRKILRTC